MGQQGNGGGGYDNTNRFTLFKNKKKQEGDNKPDLTGKVNVNGKEFWLSAWRKKAASSGEQFYSGSIQPVEDAQNGGPAPQRQQQQAQRPAGKPPVSQDQQFKDDDIPF
jgi:hypothetical protein